MQFVQAGYIESALGDSKIYIKVYTREMHVAFYGATTEVVGVSAEVRADGRTVIQIMKDGRQLHPSRGSHLYKSEGVAFAAVRATLEWMGYTI